MIAAYDSIWFDGHFEFKLDAKSIHVFGSRFLHSRIDATIPLGNLQPRVDRIWVQNISFVAGLLTAMVGLIGYCLLVRTFQVDFLNPWAVLVGGLGMAGLALATTTVRKQEFAQFVTDAGVPALQIPRSRRGKQDFELFVEQVVEQIRRCKAQS